MPLSKEDLTNILWHCADGGRCELRRQCMVFHLTYSSAHPIDRVPFERHQLFGHYLVLRLPYAVHFVLRLYSNTVRWALSLTSIRVPVALRLYCLNDIETLTLTILRPCV